MNSALLAGGTVTAVALDQYEPTAIAVGASDVFWIDGFARWIMKAPKVGGAPARVVPSPGGRELQVDAESLYWLDYDDDNTPGVFKAPLGGGTVVRLAVAAGQVQASALDATHVYWSDYDADTATSRVMKVSIDGGAPAVLHSVQFRPSIGEDLAVGPSGVYWTGIRGEDSVPNSPPNVKLSRIPLEGGEPVTLAEEPSIHDVGLDSEHVYWTVTRRDGSPGSIRKLPLGGGSVSTVASDQPGVSALAVSDANVCWLNFAVTGNAGDVMCRATCEGC